MIPADWVALIVAGFFFGIAVQVIALLARKGQP
ncbi:MAG: hypothetical protein K0Q52_1897 [Microbacterium sp.]|nr:hypothetical protein [Microbacterium sp.]